MLTYKKRLFGKSISAVILTVAFLLLAVSAPSVTSQTELENQLVENIQDIYEWMDNLNAAMEEQGENIAQLAGELENLFTSLSELGENTSELNDALQSLTGQVENLAGQMGGIANQLDELAQQFEEEETGNSMMVFAITEDGFTPLTFGFAPGSSMLMMLMLMQDGGGGLFGIQELPHEDTPILLMDSAGGLIPNASVTLYLAGENAFAPITLPVFGGISMIPRTKGMIMGTVSAPGYEGVSFFARMGEATDGTTPTEHIYFMTVATMKVGEANVLRAVDQAGKLVEGDIKVQDPDAEPAYQLQDGPNPLSFVPGSESFTASLMRDGEEIAMDTLQVPKPTGEGTPLEALAGLVFIAAVVMTYLYYVKRYKGRKLWT